MASKPRSYYMKQSFKDALGDQPRTHYNCREATGVARPGKTAQDRARESR